MNCGTERGYRDHRVRNEPPCKWCVKAVTDPAPAVKRTAKTKPKPKAQKQRMDTPRFRARYEGEIECGTPWGYQQHKARGDEDCPPCRLAANARRKEMRQARKAANV